MFSNLSLNKLCRVRSRPRNTQVWPKTIHQVEHQACEYRYFQTAGRASVAKGKDVPALFQAALPNIVIETNPYELARHGRGESHHPTRPPQAIVFPETVDDVVDICKFCNSQRIPLIPFGVGTSVEGHVCALQGGISVDTKLLQTMDLPDFTGTRDDDGTEIFPDPIASVGAGVTRKTLNSALRHTGLQFVVDPGADATLGGMTATGASGTSAVHYGTMRENLLAVEAVLADGTIVNAGTKALKNSAGYDLLGLWCGSEGTLGVITNVTVKLHPIPNHLVAAACAFNTLQQAAAAVAALKLQGISGMTRCELLDTSSVVAFNKYNKSSSNAVEEMDEQPTLIFEVQGNSPSGLQEELARIEELCVEDFGGFQFEARTDPEERSALWAARHELYYASLKLRPQATTAILTDACVPLSKFAAVIEATARDVEQQSVVGPIFGHAGDGNFHCILPICESEDESYLERAHAVNDRLIQRTLDAGGTCTGEHGVGYGKAHYLEKQYGTGAVGMMDLIKKALDPNGIMNPGKVLPPTE